MPVKTELTVFVSKVSEVMLHYKENIVKDLVNHGYSVKEPTSDEDKDIEFRPIIEQCDVALHILSDQDLQFDAFGKGIEERQVDYSVQHSLGLKLISDSIIPNFRIFAWHSKSFLDNIYREELLPKHIKKIQQIEEVDLIRTNFEDFKYYFLKKIEIEPEEKTNEFYIKGSHNLNVYLLYDVVDEVKVQQYKDYIRNRGFNLLTPLFQGDLFETRKRHINNLIDFDVVIIFSSRNNTNWLSMKIMDVLKSSGLGRKKEIKGKAIFIAGSNKSSLPPNANGFTLIDTELNSPKEQIDDLVKDLAR